MIKETKYISIKIKGLDEWIAFETKNVVEEDNHFTGSAGWGRNGVYTNIKIKQNEIIGRINSDSMYNSN